MTTRVSANMNPEGLKIAEFQTVWGNLPETRRVALQDALTSLVATRIYSGDIALGMTVEETRTFLKGCFIYACTIGETPRLPKNKAEVRQFVELGERYLEERKQEAAKYLASLGLLSISLGHLVESSMFGKSPIELAKKDLLPNSVSLSNFDRLRTYVEVSQRFIFNVANSTIKQLGDIIPEETRKRLTGNINLASIWFRGMCLSYIGKEFGIDINPIYITDENLLALSKALKNPQSITIGEEELTHDQFLEKVSTDMLGIFAQHVAAEERELVFELLWRYSRDIVSTLAKAEPYLSETREEGVSMREFRAGRERYLKGLSVSLPIVHQEIIIDSRIGTELLETAPYNIWVGGEHIEGLGTLPNDGSIRLCINLIVRSGQNENGIVDRLENLFRLINRFKAIKERLAASETLEDIDRDERAFLLTAENYGAVRQRASDYVSQLEIFAAQKRMFGYVTDVLPGRLAAYEALMGLNLPEGTVLTIAEYEKLPKEKKQLVWQKLLKEISYIYEFDSNYSFSINNRDFNFLNLKELKLEDLFIPKGSVLTRVGELRDLYRRIQTVLLDIRDETFVQKALGLSSVKVEFERLQREEQRLVESIQHLKEEIGNKQTALNKAIKDAQNMPTYGEKAVKKEENIRLARKIADLKTTKGTYEYMLEKIQEDTKKGYENYVRSKIELFRSGLVDQLYGLQDLFHKINEAEVINKFKRAEVVNLDVAKLEKYLGKPTLTKLNKAFGNTASYPKDKLIAYAQKLKDLILLLTIKRTGVGKEQYFRQITDQDAAVLKKIVESPLLRTHNTEANNLGRISTITRGIFTLPFVKDIRAGAVEEIERKAKDVYLKAATVKKVIAQHEAYNKRRKVIKKLISERETVLAELAVLNGVLTANPN